MAGLVGWHVAMEEELIDFGDRDTWESPSILRSDEEYREILY